MIWIFLKKRKNFESFQKKLLCSLQSYTTHILLSLFCFATISLKTLYPLPISTCSSHFLCHENYAYTLYQIVSSRFNVHVFISSFLPSLDLAVEANDEDIVSYLILPVYRIMSFLYAFYSTSIHLSLPRLRLRLLLSVAFM